MRPAFQQIVMVTSLPLRMVRLQRVLRAAGFEARPQVMAPQQWCASPEAQSGCLVFIDVRSAPAWYVIQSAKLQAEHGRFVLCSSSVTPHQVRSAMEAGMDGVLSLKLPVEDAARALLQICRGERQFRFEQTSVKPAILVAAASTPDFDTLWMFGMERA
jgi:DNA-binding NarL/FixJ family response regulator